MAAPLLLLCILIALASLPSLTVSNPRADILWRSCSESFATNIASYRQTFYNLTSGMDVAMRRDKSAYAEGGGGSDDEKMFVFAECLDDLSGEDCSTCFAQLRTLLPGCFPSPGGRVYLDGCYIRVDNYDFYNDTEILDDFVRCGDIEFDNEEKVGDAEEMLAGLKTNAPTSNKGYAAMNEATGSSGVYGMANCWRNVNYSNCVSCLEVAYQAALKCLPATEGRVVNTGCFMHYADYMFANDGGQAAEEGSILLVDRFFELNLDRLCA